MPAFAPKRGGMGRLVYAIKEPQKEYRRNLWEFRASAEQSADDSPWPGCEDFAIVRRLEKWRSRSIRASSVRFHISIRANHGDHLMIHSLNRFSRLGATLLATFALVGCADPNRYLWYENWFPDGEDQRELARYGPTPAQRIESVHELLDGAGGSPGSADRVTTQLGQQIRSENDPFVRLEIVNGMASIDSPTAAAILEAAMRDPEPRVRMAACKAWGERKTEQATSLLALRLKEDDDADVRIEAARALGSYKGPNNVAALAAVLEDAGSDVAVQYRAMSSLQALTGHDYGYDAKLWQAYVRGENPAEPSSSIAERVMPWWK
jgi:hypothetical protein